VEYPCWCGGSVDPLRILAGGSDVYDLTPALVNFALGQSIIFVNRFCLRTGAVMPKRKDRTQLRLISI